MSTFTKFNSFISQVAAGTHANLINASTDTVKIYLTNATPVATNTVKANIAEITMTNESNHGAGGADINNTASQTAATITVACDGTITFLASGGTVGPFTHAVAYNDTAASDELIGYWANDSGSVTLAGGESFVLTVAGAELFTLG